MWPDLDQPLSYGSSMNPQITLRQVLVFSHFANEDTEAQKVTCLAQAKAKMRGGVAGFDRSAQQKRNGRTSATSALCVLV